MNGRKWAPCSPRENVSGLSSDVATRIRIEKCSSWWPTARFGPPREALLGINLWNRSTEAPLREAAATVLPKWTLLGGRTDGQTGIQPEWQQEKTVLSTLSTPGRPLELVRRIQVPAMGSPKLRLRVSNDPAGKWQLLVHIGGRKVLEQEIDQTFTGGGLKIVDIELKPFAGQQVWVVISQIDGGGPQPYAKWKRLQLIP